MFSDVIVEHAGADVNVCWNEKTTQTNESNAGSVTASPVQPSLKRRPSQRRPGKSEDERLAAGAGLTCQELLALSGALGAALPTPLALPSYPDATSVPIDDPTPAPNSQPGVMPILAMSLWPEPFSGIMALTSRAGPDALNLPNENGRRGAVGGGTRRFLCEQVERRVFFLPSFSINRRKLLLSSRAYERSFASFAFRCSWTSNEKPPIM